MNTRKFTYITTIIVGIFLFFLGTVFLFYINNKSPEGGAGSLTQIFEGLGSTTKNEPMNFLLFVGDKSSGNTDVMLVANYSPATNQISIVTIPRDTKVKLKNSTVPKINSAYAAGGQEHKGATYASQVVSDLTGININYYVHLNISCIKGITEMLGGVYFDVPFDLRYSDPTQNLKINLKKGNQLLNGDKVEQLLRFRKPSERMYTRKELEELEKYYDGSDIKRTEIQVKFIKEFIRQKLTIQYLPKFNSVLNYAFQNIITNMTLTDALKLTSGLLNISADNFNSFRLDGDSDVINKGWYYIYNGKFIRIDTKESLPAEEVVPKYFYSANGIVAPSGELFVPADNSEDTTPPAATKKTSKFKKKNPSNSRTNVKGSGKDRP